MVPDREDFYEPELLEPARCDIFENVPFPKVPAEPFYRSVLITPSMRDPAQTIQLAADADNEVDFLQDAAEMFSGILAMCITPTCDLVDANNLLFLPIEPCPDEWDAEQRSKVRSGVYENVAGVYDPIRGEADDYFVDFSKVFHVPRESFEGSANRFRSLSAEAHDYITAKLAEYLGKAWGYSPSEPVEKEGIYGCITCRKYYGISFPEISLKAGERPPQCPNCRENKKSSSWRILRKPKPRLLLKDNINKV